MALAIHLSGIRVVALSAFSHALAELLKTMWWGIASGIFATGLMSKIPKEYFSAVMGRGDTFGGLLRAALAGLLLDLCSHGILMVGAKLYERGASLAQVMTFLISSPWNSLTLTLILFSLVGSFWTLAFIAGSVVIAIATGALYLVLVKKGVLPPNPNTTDIPEGFKIGSGIKAGLKNFRLTPQGLLGIFLSGLADSRMVLRWLLFGTVLAALIQAFVPTDFLMQWFGPSLIGLALTLVATTIIEVCSEGSTPIAAQLVVRAHAPGNGFAFLMAGVSTDYTEIMVLREITKSWEIALSLPLLTVPQIILLGWIMNNMAGAH